MLPSEILVCPDGPGRPPATGATPAALAAQHARPGHVSFDYLGGAGRRFSDFGADDVVVFEAPFYHDSDGGNALFGDGYVEFVYPASELRERTQRVREGSRPVPPTRSPRPPARPPSDRVRAPGGQLTNAFSRRT